MGKRVALESIMIRVMQSGYNKLYLKAHKEQMSISTYLSSHSDPKKKP